MRLARVFGLFFILFCFSFTALAQSGGYTLPESFYNSQNQKAPQQKVNRKRSTRRVRSSPVERQSKPKKVKQKKVYSGDRLAQRYVSFSIPFTYSNQAIMSSIGNAFCGFSFGGSTVGGTNCFAPEHMFTIGGHIQVSLPIGHRWALRLEAGYSYTVAEDFIPGTGGVSTQFRHGLSADILFDLYFNTSSKFHPYFSFGVGVRHTLLFTPFIAGGGLYELSDKWALQFELKAGSAIVWSYIEPTFGVAMRF